MIKERRKYDKLYIYMHVVLFMQRRLLASYEVEPESDNYHNNADRNMLDVQIKSVT